MKHPAILLHFYDDRQKFATLLEIARHCQGCKIFCYGEINAELFDEELDFAISYANDERLVEYSILSAEELQHLRQVGLVDNIENKKASDGEQISIITIDDFDEKAYATLYFITCAPEYSVSYIVTPKDTEPNIVMAFIVQENKLFGNDPTSSYTGTPPLTGRLFSQKLLENMTYLADSLDFLLCGLWGGECNGSPSVLFSCNDDILLRNIKTLPRNISEFVPYSDEILLQYEENYGPCTCFYTGFIPAYHIGEDLHKQLSKAWQTWGKKAKPNGYSPDDFIKKAIEYAIKNPTLLK